MEIRNNLNALNPVSGVRSAQGQAGSGSSQPQTSAQQASGIDHATVSVAGRGVSQVGDDADVRWDKVKAVSGALADGTYDVPASAVAASVVGSMLGDRS